MKKILIIAEAGVNHNGSLSKAKKLIDLASKAGADIIKFQTFKTKNLLTKSLVKAKYQIDNNNKNEKQFEMLSKLELKSSYHYEIARYCKKKNIEFLSTAFDLESLNFLNNFNLKRLKIPSGEITNFPYLKHIAGLKKKIILSTGMSKISEIQEAIKVLLKYGATKNKITLLHCTTEYPTPYEEVNLHAMLQMKSKFNTKVGYSDHTNGIEIPIAAAALGASIIEKHITLSKKLEGPDHKSSLEFEELNSMIKSIRNIEVSLGTGIKKPTKSEYKNRNIIRKFIVAKIDILKGTILTEKNLTVKRSGKRINPMNWNKLLGKKAIKDFKKDQIIKI